MRTDCDKEVMIVCSFYLDTKRNVWKCLRHGLSIPGTGRGWGLGARRWGRVREIMTITVSWGRPRVRGARGHRSRGRAVIKESNDLPSAVLIFFP